METIDAASAKEADKEIGKEAAKETSKAAHTRQVVPSNDAEFRLKSTRQREQEVGERSEPTMETHANLPGREKKKQKKGKKQQRGRRRREKAEKRQKKDVYSPARVRVHATGGLIQENHSRAAQKGNGYAQLAALTSGQIPSRCVQLPMQTCDAHGAKHQQMRQPSAFLAKLCTKPRVVYATWHMSVACATACTLTYAHRPMRLQRPGGMQQCEICKRREKGSLLQTVYGDVALPYGQACAASIKR